MADETENVKGQMSNGSEKEKVHMSSGTLDI